ncbi:MAG: hypothetical protein AVDCRST_MAG73-829 [uncultured Thermomicrobiales bacterium]|uniref:Uncharacterized protein n=1 Tax=uncultured Thermomicrobiales bacterium TaxID=1645740 RepID=A0A6J4TRM7_9BACT|nr:MAG: hypothetical protein AVDCRST_MAG73-829 [uncultured Thermomicrobiales bacterium]
MDEARWDLGDAGGAPDDTHADHRDEVVETLARTVAHLAAQLTVNQIRLRALATELADRTVLDPVAVAARVRAIADAEAGTYLRENLGDALRDVIDVDALEGDLVAYLSATDEV